MDQFQRASRQGTDTAFAFIVLSESLAQVVGMTDVERPVGAFEDVQGEFHFQASLPTLDLFVRLPFDFAAARLRSGRTVRESTF
jgi:hypothetical protein